MRIRKSTKNEVSTQIRLLVRYSSENTTRYENLEASLSREITKNSIYRLRALEKYNLYYTIIEKEMVIGYLWLQVVERTIRILNIYILKAYRGKGFGLKTMKWIEKNRDRLHAGTIRLLVHTKNVAAVNLYKKAGFEEVKKHMIKT